MTTYPPSEKFAAKVLAKIRDTEPVSVKRLCLLLRMTNGDQVWSAVHALHTLGKIEQVPSIHVARWRTVA